MNKKFLLSYIVMVSFSLTGCVENNIKKDDVNNDFPRFIKVSMTTDLYDDVILVSGDGRFNEDVKLMVSKTECYFEYYKNNILIRKLDTDCKVTENGEIEASAKYPFED